MLIFRRTNCIITAPGIVTLRKRLYSTPVESGLQSALNPPMPVPMPLNVVVGGPLWWKFRKVELLHITLELHSNPDTVQPSLKAHDILCTEITFYTALRVTNTRGILRYRGAGKSLTRPTSRCISFDASLVIYK